MKHLVRSILVFTLLLAIAQPTYACIICLYDGTCGWGGGNRCKPLEPGGCYAGQPCGGGGGGFTASLASEYRIASVEVTHGSGAKVLVAANKKQAPARVVAEARK